MFTGLVKELGRIQKATSNDSGKELIIECSSLRSEIAVDNSISVNGVCLTATAVGKNYFRTQVVHVTLEKTTLGGLREGELVNLELALKPLDRLGGHFVEGHVNDTAELIETKRRGENREIIFKMPNSLRKYIIKEGPIALDGIGLTIADEKDFPRIKISIIPYTWENTNLKIKKAGDKVNVEVDVLAKYVENILRYGSNAGPGPDLKEEKSFYGKI